jgi:hypothetical protein
LSVVAIGVEVTMISHARWDQLRCTPFQTLFSIYDIESFAEIFEGALSLADYYGPMHDGCTRAARREKCPHPKPKLKLEFVDIWTN